jgi:hypothetical protein
MDNSFFDESNYHDKLHHLTVTNPAEELSLIQA